MGSTEQISGGGGRGSDPASAAFAQPGSAATALFPFYEADLPARLGVPLEKIAAERRGLVQGVDWYRINRTFRWSEAGVEKLAAALGSTAVAADVKTAPGAPLPEKTAAPGQPAPAKLKVVNVNIPNKRLILCRDAAGQSVTVFINPAWRARFRHGMEIEATRGTGGRWHTRCPRFVGKF
jgi:hypothetical protein